MALEELGMKIHRFTLRRYDGDLVDEHDRAERERARVLLDAGAWGLMAAVLRAAVRRPRVFARAASLAARAGPGQRRGLFRNLVYLAEACLLLEWLTKLKVDHLHCHYGTNSAAVAMLCRVLGGRPIASPCMVRRSSIPPRPVLRGQDPPRGVRGRD